MPSCLNSESMQIFIVSSKGVFVKREPISSDPIVLSKGIFVKENQYLAIQ